MVTAVVALTIIGLVLGYLLGLAARRFHVEEDPLIDEIAGMLPGTQCGQCGFPGCGQAAAALASGQASVTCCPPGGRALAEALARRLGVPIDLPAGEEDGPRLALVDESLCIGCVKCYKACPTDAIVGAPKQIHVVMQRACTGCGACIDVCPTECLTLVGTTATLGTWRWPKPLPEAA